MYPAHAYTDTCILIPYYLLHTCVLVPYHKLSLSLSQATCAYIYRCKKRKKKEKKYMHTNSLLLIRYMRTSPLSQATCAYIYRCKKRKKKKRKNIILFFKQPVHTYTDARICVFRWRMLYVHMDAGCCNVQFQ